MARIIGVEVPPNKRIDVALRYIYGIGPSNSKVILAKAHIDPGIRATDLTEPQLIPATLSNRPCDPGRQIRHRR